MATIKAMVVMLATRRFGPSKNNMKSAAATMKSGMILKIIKLYSPMLFSVRTTSVSTKAEASVL